MLSLPAISLVPITTHEPWMLWTFLLCFALLAWVRYSYPSRWNTVFSSTFNVRMTKQLMREEGVLAHRSSAVMLFLFSICVAFPLYWIGVANGLENGLPMFSMILLATIILSLLHWGLHALIGAAMADNTAISEYMFTISLIHKSSTLVLLPLLFCYSFSGTILATVCAYLIASTILGIIVYRASRGLMIAWGIEAPIHYFILYLCALEFLPLLIVGKGVIEFVS